MQLDIKPFVRFSRIQCIFPRGINIGYDHRLFYCLSGKGVIRIKNTDFNVVQGSVLYWPSGMPYSYYPDEDQPFKLVGINFDFNNSSYDKSTPIPPTYDDKFNEDNIIEKSVTVHKIFEEVLYIKNGFKLQFLFNSINRNFTQKRLYYNDLCSSILSQLIVELIRTANTSRYEPSMELIDSIMTYINEHLQENLSNQIIGSRFGYHANYINRLIVSSTGKSLHSYVIECRINRAIELLQDSELSIGQVSELVGFYDISGFSKTFRRIVGTSPSEFRRSS